MSTDMQSLREEIGRDQWLAAAAAGMVADRVPLDEIDTEALEALSEMIRQELLDRDLRTAKTEFPQLPF